MSRYGEEAEAEYAAAMNAQAEDAANRELEAQHDSDMEAAQAEDQREHAPEATTCAICGLPWTMPVDGGCEHNERDVIAHLCARVEELESLIRGLADRAAAQQGKS